MLATLLVPQGMAYAELAGLPPVTGLYATLVPLFVYFLLGPSRILVLRPDSAVSPLVAAAIMFVGGLARFGFVTELLSTAIREFVEHLGDTNAAALAIGVGSLAVILVLRRFAPRLPGVFFAVVAATLAVREVRHLHLPCAAVRVAGLSNTRRSPMA